MKVIHVIPSFFPDYVAGTEVYCWTLCKHLQRYGIATEVLIPGFGLQETTDYEYDGIRVTKYAEPTKQTRLHIAGLVLPEGISNFREYLVRSNPDCIHIHGIYPGIGITIQHIEEAKSLGIRVIYTMHLSGHICSTQTLIHNGIEPCDGVIRPVRCATCNLIHRGNNKVLSRALAGISDAFQKTGIDSGYWNNRLGTALSGVNRITDLKANLDRLAVLCDKVVVLAKWFREIMAKNNFPVERMEYVPPAISYLDEPVKPLPSLRFNHKGSIKLIFVGRIDPIKDLQLLLRAFNDLPEDKIELSIYGKPLDPSYYDQCRKLAEKNRNVHWRGIFAREELMTIFRQHDMLCLPSALSEMSPLVIQEAFGARIPVLASGVLGNEELINHNQNGLLFPFKSQEGLFQQLHRLIDEPKLLMSLKNGIVLPLPFEEVVRKYLDIYNFEVRRENQNEPVRLRPETAEEIIDYSRYIESISSHE